MTDPSPQVLIRDGVINAATLWSCFLARGEIRARLHARCNPRFELIGLATIDLDGVITVVHPFARDECETPAVPAAAERLHDRRTQ
jgi:hypothetical protein